VRLLVEKFKSLPCRSLMSKAKTTPDRNAAASPRRVGEALYALDGLGSLAGSCVWHVIGLQRSIREWAMRQGWGGRPVRVEQARGILVAALGVLAGHYGYGRS
jgi:hypothetical protein